jgi:hypothetical protein
LGVCRVSWTRTSVVLERVLSNSFEHFLCEDERLFEQSSETGKQLIAGTHSFVGLVLDFVKWRRRVSDWVEKIHRKNLLPIAAADNHVAPSMSARFSYFLLRRENDRRG